MTPTSFFAPKMGQSLLMPGVSEVYRGQCVMSVGLWVQALGLKFPTYPSAYLYYQNGIPGYTKIPAGQPIQEADIIVWREDFPPAIFKGVGNGHIDVADAPGTLHSFTAYDSNWSPPLKLNRILHTGNDNNYIAGYLRRSEVFTQDNYNAISRAFKDLGQTPPPPGVAVGFPVSAAITALLNAPEWSIASGKARVDKANLDILNEVIGYPTPPPDGVALGTFWPDAINQLPSLPETQALLPRGGTTDGFVPYSGEPLYLKQKGK